MQKVTQPAYKYKRSLIPRQDQQYNTRRGKGEKGMEGEHGLADRVGPSTGKHAAAAVGEGDFGCRLQAMVPESGG